MQGQHIFMRCWNEQNNAGTWTAAVTDQVADKNVIRNEIEPRCNIDETFAQAAMLQHPANNILRIYPLENDVLVVSRTFWENDRVTEASGRKGAYTVSHIITEKDVDRYCEDFVGAFDEGCFEIYDSVVQRMQAAGTRRVLIDPKYSIFSHAQKAVNSRVFQQLGFSKKMFIDLMEGLYNAVEKNDKIAVVLPTEERQSWVTKGNSQAEELLCAILSVLPVPMRKNVGMVSHWNCAVWDKMLRGIHLILVHPESEEKLSELRRSGAKIIDLDTGRHTTNISSVAKSYFSFLWDHLDQPEEIQSLWQFAMEKCGGVLRRLPCSAAAMECVYSIRTASNDGFQNAPLCRKAYIKASKVFAGAGKAIPAIEEIISAALKPLERTDLSVDSEMERAIISFVSRDQTQTSHQLLEYRLLFSCIDAGTASTAVTDTFRREIEKPSRSADALIGAYLEERTGLPISDLNESMIALTTGLFNSLSQESNELHAELFGTVRRALSQWTPQLADAGRWDLLQPLVPIYAEYLRSRGKNALTVSNCYQLLFRLSLEASGNYQTQCEEALSVEEKRIYTNPSLATDGGTTRLSIFYMAFVDLFPLSKDLSDTVRSQVYQRFYRLGAFVSDDIRDVILTAYGEQLLSNNDTLRLDGGDPALFSSQVAAVSDMMSAKKIWNTENIRKSVIAFEKTTIDLARKYCPDKDRLTFLLDTFGDLEPETCDHIIAYLNRIPAAQRPDIYDLVREKQQIGRLYVYSLTNDAASKYRVEIESYLDHGHDAWLKMYIDSQFVIGKNHVAKEIRLAFREWYSHEFQEQFKHHTVFLDRLAIINNEYAKLEAIESERRGLKGEAVDVLDDLLTAQMDALPQQQLAELPKKAISAIASIITSRNLENNMRSAAGVQLIQKLDSVDPKNAMSELDSLCSAYGNGPMKQLIAARLKYYVRHYRASDGDQGLAWNCELFRALVENVEIPFVMSFSKGEMASVYNEMDTRSRILLILDMMRSVDFQSSNYRRRVNREAILSLTRMLSQEPACFRDAEIRAKYGQLRYLNADDRRSFARRLSRFGVKPDRMAGTWSGFSLKIILLCVVGAAISLTVFAGVLALMHMLHTINTWVSIITGVLIFVVCISLRLILKQLDRSRADDSNWGQF